MHFAVFVPKATSVDDLAKAGLIDLCQNAQCTAVNTGPDGNPGLLFWWAVAGYPHLTSYRTEGQTWIPAAPFGHQPAGRYFVGFKTDSPPTAAELARPYRYAGAPVPLGDGCEWIVPRAAELPGDFVLADDGTWKWEVQRRFADYLFLAKAWSRRFHRLQAGESLPNSDLIDFAIWTLGINYRLTREVVSHLRLFSGGHSGTLKVCFEAITGVCVGGDDE